jgi:hypothetical protein
MSLLGSKIECSLVGRWPSLSALHLSSCQLFSPSSFLPSLPLPTQQQIRMVHSFAIRDWKAERRGRRVVSSAEIHRKKIGEEEEEEDAAEGRSTAKKDICSPYHSLNNFVYLLKTQGKN